MSDIREEVPVADREQMLAVANEFTQTARKVCLEYYQAGFSYEAKADKSLVTEADKRIEEIIREDIAKRFPDHGVIGEEFPDTNTGADFVWVLDPIDGTEEFVNRTPTFGGIIALRYKGQPLVGVIDLPAVDLEVHGGYGLGTYAGNEKISLSNDPPETRSVGLRLNTSTRNNFMHLTDEGEVFEALTRSFTNHRAYHSCFAHYMVLTGGADVHVEYNTKLWDMAPLPVLATEAGGEFRLLREYTPEGGTTHYVSIFGRKAEVEKVMAVLEPALLGVKLPE